VLGLEASVIFENLQPAASVCSGFSFTLGGSADRRRRPDWLRTENTRHSAIPLTPHRGQRV